MFVSPGVRLSQTLEREGKTVRTPLPGPEQQISRKAGIGISVFPVPLEEAQNHGVLQLEGPFFLFLVMNQFGLSLWGGKIHILM